MFCGPEDSQDVGRMGIMIRLEGRMVCVYISVCLFLSVCVCVCLRERECVSVWREWYRIGYPHSFQSLSAAPSAPKSGVFGVALASESATASKVYSINGEP